MFENCHLHGEDALPVTASAVDISRMSIGSTLRGQDREAWPSGSVQEDEACTLLSPAHLPNAPGAGRRRGREEAVALSSSPRPGQKGETNMLLRSIRWPHTRHILSFLIVCLATGSTALAGI